MSNTNRSCFLFLCCILSVILAAAGNRAYSQTTVFELEKVMVSDENDDQNNTSGETATIDQKPLKSHKVVDLAEILSDELIEASMIRKSGYGNEVGLRGFTKSNLRFSQDNTLIEGSCGSRKDPPLSHINLLTIQKIEVKEGPFDVTVPGALGGNINVTTKETQSGIHGGLLSKFGSFGYLSQGAYLTGGNDSVQGLLGYNYSRSDQYKDGDGNSLSSYNPNYNEKGEKLDAFKKHDLWSKVMVKPAENQKLLLSLSLGRADDILTPRVGMDTEKEITCFGRMEYSLSDLGPLSRLLKMSAYYNRIEHYPFGKYRSNAVNDKKIEAISSITGAQVRNSTQSSFALFTCGMDFYYRNWYGNILNRDTDAILNDDLFPDVDETNFGLFIKAEKEIGKLQITAGLRGDVFSTKAHENLKFSETITETNKSTDIFPGGSIFLKYFFKKDTSIFWGAGLSSRTPTAVERYIQESSTYFGNPDIKPSHNIETDLGFNLAARKIFSFKAKTFYSYLKDFIYQEERSSGVKTYTNIDAFLYGADATADLHLKNGTGLSGGVAWQRGSKLEQPDNNNDKDLAEISPLKTKAALYYDRHGLYSLVEWVHSEKSSDIDSDAGETSLGGWDIFNFRISYYFGGSERIFSALEGLSLNFGIDNIFNKCYAVANSYEYDPTDPGGSNAKIVNEPGRFIYGSLSYSF